VNQYRGPVLATSRPLLQWLREDPSWASLPLALRARLQWQANWGSLNAGLSRALAAQNSEPTLEDPVLIVGPWRSGTTVMHELLAAALGAATPSTWQCMNACAFELTSRRGRGRAIARPMDGLEISDESPQEDEFALLALGADSAYRSFWMPHRIGELQYTLDPEYWLADSSWLVAWEAFLRGVLRTSHAQRPPLLLKSPNHTYRLPAIVRRFPGARLVWMARDPATIWHSNRKMWTSMFAAHGLTGARGDALDEFLVRAIDAAAASLRWCMQNIDRARWTVVRQEDLRADPMAQTLSVLASLGLGGATDTRAFDAAVTRTRAGRVDHYAHAPAACAHGAIERLGAAQTVALAA
jgi:omega-hydroxy-beta-dihydromenaquinone-9 sulfotransferase